MTDFKVKKGILDYKKVSIEDWNTEQMVRYFKDIFKNQYRVDTRRPIGQIKKYINKRNIFTLWRMEGKSPDLNQNDLFKQFIEWNIQRKPMDKFRIWLLGKQENMADFLDERAKKLVDYELGSLEEFKEQEEKERQETIEHFRKLGMDV